MGWRDFLRPDARKNLITLFLIILFLILQISFTACNVMVIGTHPFYCNILGLIGGMIFYSVFIIFFKVPPYESLLQTTPISNILIDLIGYILFYYMLSCFFIWLFGRRFRK